MLRSILFTVLALGAQGAWAQDEANPMLVDDSDIVAEDTEASETEDIPKRADGTGTEVVDGEIDDPATEVIDDEGTDVVDGETGDPETGDAFEAQHDNRSPRGAFRGGHHGQVSTLARAGLGRVFGSLRSQGYGNIQIKQAGDEILISATRGDELRQLSYDAPTGALISDVLGPSPQGIVETVTSKFKQIRDRRGRKARNVAESSGGASEKRKDGDGSKGGGSKGGGGSKDGGKGGGSKGGGKGNGSKGGSNGKGGGNKHK